MNNCRIDCKHDIICRCVTRNDLAIHLSAPGSASSLMEKLCAPIVPAWRVWEKRALTSVLRCLHWRRQSSFSRIRPARQCLASGSDRLLKRLSMPKVQASSSSVRGENSTKSDASPSAEEEPTGVRHQRHLFHLRPLRLQGSTHRLQPKIAPLVVSLAM